jgi:Glyoxalase-like domain
VVATPVPQLPRLRQTVLAAAELEPVVTRLRQSLSLGEPFADPGVSHFGLHNAVFAIGDTFLEVVAPVQDGTSVGRLLERREGDCGYMVMFEIEDLDAARARAAEHGVREVFEIELDDVREVHLHPADMEGAIVALSEPRPHGSWRWGGPNWAQRSVSGGIVGATIEVADSDAVSERWRAVIGGLPGITLTSDPAAGGPIEYLLELPDARPQPVHVGTATVTPGTGR